MMRVRITGHNGESCFPFEDRTYWLEFKNSLEKFGFEIVEEEYGSKVDALIAMGFAKMALGEAKLNHLTREKRVLIVWEPPCASKRLHSSLYQKNFGVIAVPNPHWSKVENFVTFIWPQESFSEEIESFSEWNLRLPRIIFMQGNKLSFHKNELYSLRRTVIGGRLASHIDIFGFGWNSHKIDLIMILLRKFLPHPTLSRFLRHSQLFFATFINYQGESSNKMLTSQNYQIALVIENSPDYTSEKLFEASRAGNLVIYVGNFLENYKNEAKFLNIEPNEEAINIALQEALSMSPILRFQTMIEQQQILKRQQVFLEYGNPMKDLATKLSVILHAD